MNKRVFNIIGWILLLGLGASWIRFGYSDLYLIILPAASVCFSISDGRIKKIKEMSTLQVLLILFALIASVGIVFGLIQLSSYLINDKLHLTGWVKTISQIIAVIVSLYPVKFTFVRIIYKVNDDINAKILDRVRTKDLIQ